MSYGANISETQRQAGNYVGRRIVSGRGAFALVFFLIIFDHRDGILRIAALVSFGFLCLTTAYRLIKELRSS